MTNDKSQMENEKWKILDHEKHPCPRRAARAQSGVNDVASNSLALARLKHSV
jgi:hypothetical protein